MNKLFAKSMFAGITLGLLTFSLLYAASASALTIPSGSVITSDGEVVPFHETENAQTQVEQNGYAILGNNVVIDGVPGTLTIEEALDLVRNGIADADLPDDVKAALLELDDADLENAVEALNSGQVSIEEIQAGLNGGPIPDVDLGPDNG